MTTQAEPALVLKGKLPELKDAVRLLMGVGIESEIMRGEDCNMNS